MLEDPWPGAHATSCAQHGICDELWSASEPDAHAARLHNPALILGAKAGIDPNILWSIVKASSGNSATWAGGVKAILKDKLSPNFTVSLAFKDINLATDLAKELGVDLPVGSVTQRLLKEFCQNGFANEDILATIKVLESSSGASIRGQWRD